MHGKGRVFYTSMGHREDVWENPKYQGLLLGALGWATGKDDVDVTPNIKKVTPDVRRSPPENPESPRAHRRPGRLFPLPRSSRWCRIGEQNSEARGRRQGEVGL